MVMAQSLIRLVQAQGWEVDCVAPPAIVPLVRRMPQVGAAIALEVRHGEFGWRARMALGRALRTRHYQRAIILPNSWKSALVPFLARVPVRTGYLGEGRFGLINDRRTLDKGRLPRMVDRYAALAVKPGETFDAARPQLEPRRESAEHVLAVLNRKMPEAPVLGLCPGAEYGPAKRWPPAYFAQVAEQMLSRGWDVWIFGSARDRPIAAEIQEATTRRCLDLTGHTQLDEAVDLLAVCTAVVTNDSGLMHIAAALRIPMVAIFGSSSPAHTPPLAEQVQILHLGLPCAPCFERTCPLGHTRCLRDLTPDMAITALRALLPALVRAW